MDLLEVRNTSHRGTNGIHPKAEVSVRTALLHSQRLGVSPLHARDLPRQHLGQTLGKDDMRGTEDFPPCEAFDAQVT